MSLDVGFDLEALVAPISEESPIGEPPSEDSFDSPLIIVRGACRDASRFEATARQKESNPDSDGYPSEWGQAFDEWVKARDTGLKLLAEDWKDLEVVSFVIQALSRTDGFAGVAFGYELAAELVANYFPKFFESWGNNANLGMKPFAQLNSVLPNALRRAPITDGDGQYSLLQYTVASKLDGLDDEEKQRHMARGAITKITFQSDVDKSSESFYRDLVDTLERCQAAVKRFSEVVYEQLNELEELQATPPSGEIEEILSDILQLIKEVAENKLQIPVEEEEVSEGDSEASGETNSGSTAPARGGGEIRRPQTRDEAFRQLEYVADYFERNEPQSLLPSQIRRVIRQGTMSPKDLLSEILDDSSARNQLFRLVGIEIEDDDSY